MYVHGKCIFIWIQRDTKSIPEIVSLTIHFDDYSQ